MSNDNAFERLWKLQTQVIRLVLDGKRDPQELISFYQKVVDQRRWELRNGLIYFSVTSDGTTGRRWLRRLNDSITNVRVEKILLSPNFQPTNGITSTVCVIPGKKFFTNPTLSEVGSELDQHGLKHGLSLNIELTCLICSKLANEDLSDMGLKRILVMHDPVKTLENTWHMLTVDHSSRGCPIIEAHCVHPHVGIDRNIGFAGVVPQTALS